MHINNEGGNNKKKPHRIRKEKRKKIFFTENHKMPLFTKDYCYLKSMLQNNQYVNARHQQIPAKHRFGDKVSRQEAYV